MRQRHLSPSKKISPQRGGGLESSPCDTDPDPHFKNLTEGKFLPGIKIYVIGSLSSDESVLYGYICSASEKGEIARKKVKAVGVSNKFVNLSWKIK